MGEGMKVLILKNSWVGGLAGCTIVGGRIVHKCLSWCVFVCTCVCTLQVVSETVWAFPIVLFHKDPFPLY